MSTLLKIDIIKKIMKKIIIFLGFALILSGLGIFFLKTNFRTSFISPKIELQKQMSLKPLSKYSFEQLAKQNFSGSQIKLEKIIKEEDGFTSWLFSYNSYGKKITGMANIPQQQKLNKMPVIVMLRGYADDEIYFTGLGTRHAAEKFAEDGFITLAPDFLGFGGSDSASADVLEARFTRPITVLNLLASIKSLTNTDTNHIFLWGHSNGGQIALSILEITQANFPTSLWAPVTMSFPESILEYMDDYENLDELGKQVYNRIQDFCLNYDEKQFSIANYFDQIKAPIQVHQGGADIWVNYQQTEKFIKTMKSKNKQINYYFYPNSDHNLKQDWDQVVEKDLKFFKSFL